MILLIKLFLAPSFVVAASLAARRFGARAGGLMGGLPVVAGPILLVFAMAHGEAFAADAAAGTLLGLVSLTSFAVVYAHVARHQPWNVSLLLGWGAFLLATAGLSLLAVGPEVALVLACATFAGGLAILPRARHSPGGETPPPAWDLPLRAASALVLVLALTAVAGTLGLELSGLLAPFPVIASVLAAFTHAQNGWDYLVRLLHGLIAGFVAFALFCYVLALSLSPMGIAPAFLLAAAIALLVQAMAFKLSRRAPAVG